MTEINLFDEYIAAASIASSFATIGGDCDEFMRFLQLEWESYAEEYTEEQKHTFYGYLKSYKEMRNMVKRDWRDDFEKRNHFGTIV